LNTDLCNTIVERTKTHRVAVSIKKQLKLKAIINIVEYIEWYFITHVHRKSIFNALPSNLFNPTAVFTLVV
jgi:hypothetical protein